jgi:hypothetical protein
VWLFWRRGRFVGVLRAGYVDFFFLSSVGLRLNFDDYLSSLSFDGVCADMGYTEWRTPTTITI